MNLTRRSFLTALGATVAAIVLPEPEKVRRYWAVPRNAPVGGGLAWSRSVRLEQIIPDVEHERHVRAHIEAIMHDGDLAREIHYLYSNKTQTHAGRIALVEDMRKSGLLCADDVERVLSEPNPYVRVGSRVEHYGDKPEPVFELPTLGLFGIETYEDWKNAKFVDWTSPERQEEIRQHNAEVDRWLREYEV